MIELAKAKKLFSKVPKPLFVDEENKVMTVEVGANIFVFNFNPTASFENYAVKTGKSGEYKVIFSSDDSLFGGWDRVSKDVIYKTEGKGKKSEFPIYLPSRVAICLAKVNR